MKKIAVLIIAIFTLQSCISVRVNADIDPNAHYTKADNPNIKVQGTYFVEGFSDEKWSNSNNYNSTKAKFEKSTGTTYIKLDVKKKMSVEFRSIIKLKGDLNFKIIDKNESILFERHLNDSKEEVFTVDFPKSGDYQIIWNQQAATGSYFLEWKEN